MTTVEDLLSGGGSPSAKFPEVGTVVKGSIVGTPTAEQQTDFNTKLPKTWDNGDPMMQIVATLQTDERDPEIEDDDGQRRVFVKGKMLQSLRDALQAAGVKTIAEGGTLAIRYSGDGTPSKPGLNPPKLFEIRYTAPPAGVAVPAASADAWDA